MAQLRSTAVLALLTWLLPACGGDDADAPVAVPSVRVSSVTPSVGPRWEYVTDGPPPTLIMPCDGVVAIGAWTDPTTFLARPPGGCGETQNCGYVKIVAAFGGTEITEGALLTPALFQLDSKFAGTGLVSATVVRDDGSDYLDLENQPIVDSLETTFEAASGCE